MDIVGRLQEIRKELPEQVQLVAVSKFHPVPVLLEAYRAGQRIFGESKVQEITAKYDQLPNDIEWHFIGHLQSNKVRYIAPFIHTIHSVDSLKLMEEINKHAGLFNRKIRVLLQVHIAEEATKFGLSYEDCEQLLQAISPTDFPHIRLAGLMGMATYTDDEKQIRKEFAGLASFFRKIKRQYFPQDSDFRELSMGMSDDYLIAVQEGSTLVRIGSKLFGERN